MLNREQKQQNQLFCYRDYFQKLQIYNDLREKIKVYHYKYSTKLIYNKESLAIIQPITGCELYTYGSIKKSCSLNQIE